MSKMTVTADAKPMLNAYPDSVGGTLSDITGFLQKPELKDVFSSFYILPSLYHSDLDRGFSVIDYDLNEQLANRKDLEQLKDMGIDLKLDFILNHASAQSPQFRDLVEKGEDSAYRNFFIDWNHFWEGHGTMTGSLCSGDRRPVPPGGGISGWKKSAVLEYLLSGGAWQTVSRADGCKHPVTKSVGVLS